MRWGTNNVHPSPAVLEVAFSDIPGLVGDGSFVWHSRLSE